MEIVRTKKTKMVEHLIHPVSCPAYLTTSTAAPASQEEASRYEFTVVQDTVTSHKSDLPARHGINVNPSGRFPSERLRPDGSLDTGMPAEARDLPMTSLRCHVTVTVTAAFLMRPLH